MVNSKFKSGFILLIIVALSIAVISYTDMVIRPGYLIKTMVKAPIFLFIPILYGVFIDKTFNPFRLLTSNLKGLNVSLLLGIAIYIVMVGFYLLAENIFNLEGIKSSLEDNLGINQENFFAIALYVSIVNSFLEEWFFRGLIFSEFKKHGKLAAYLLSSLSFSIYHVAIMDGMFDGLLILLILLGLFVGGTIFNFLNEKNNNIYSSWFCHAFANFAMNTVGFLIFFGK